MEEEEDTFEVVVLEGVISPKYEFRIFYKRKTKSKIDSKYRSLSQRSSKCKERICNELYFLDLSITFRNIDDEIIIIIIAIVIVILIITYCCNSRKRKNNDNYIESLYNSDSSLNSNLYSNLLDK